MPPRAHCWTCQPKNLTLPCKTITHPLKTIAAKRRAKLIHFLPWGYLLALASFEFVIVEPPSYPSDLRELSFQHVTTFRTRHVYENITCLKIVKHFTIENSVCVLMQAEILAFLITGWKHPFSLKLYKVFVVLLLTLPNVRFCLAVCHQF